MNQVNRATLDEKILNQWIGKQQKCEDTITAKPAIFLQATLDNASRNQSNFNQGSRLPEGWHWLYFLEARPMSELGRDGHPRLGDFLPPVALPRRMWAGARIQFHQPILIGDQVSRLSTIEKINLKSGKSGKLCFVTVKHQFFTQSILKMEEEHDIVYREDPREDEPPSNPPAAPQDADVSETITPTSTLLFRYSALTFNGHRIHYDLDYCRNVEGYPGLVFHAPLTATLMLDLAARNIEDPIKRFELRATSPLFDNNSFSIHLKQNSAHYDLWATNPDGNLSMKALISV